MHFGGDPAGRHYRAINPSDERQPWEGPSVIAPDAPLGTGLGMSDILLRVIAFFVLTTATTILMMLAYY
jgi:hypothetical protein